MRSIFIIAALFVTVSAGHAETWISREGDCGEWQARWDVQQEPSGVWFGIVEHVHIGGPCARATGVMLRSEARAVIAGDNLFAFRATGNKICNYIGQMRGENRARGVWVCEDQRRYGFVVRFRAPREERSLREMPPDDELLTQEQRQQPDRRFQFRGLDELFRR